MTQRTIGALFYPGFEMLDIYGPLEMFSMHQEAFKLVGVGQSMDPVPPNVGPATQPDESFAAGTQFDIVIVPGGWGTQDMLENAALLDWLRGQAQAGATMTSICTGSALLAVAGLLDGRKATTNKLAFDWVAGLRSTVDWQARARWVRDGPFVTASGVSAGMDMALDVIDDMLGPQAAKAAATWTEYTANTDPDNDPFARTDR